MLMTGGIFSGSLCFSSSKFLNAFLTEVNLVAYVVKPCDQTIWYQGRRRVLKSGPAEEIIECRRHERGGGGGGGGESARGGTH